MARPTSLTPAVQATICTALEKGHYRKTAAALAGIALRTLYNWEERGETGEEPYESFLHAMQKAEAIAEDAALTRIIEAQPAVPGEGGRGADLWQKDAWRMERRWPSRWGGRVRATVTDELAAVLKRIEAKLDPETFAKVVDAAREDAPATADNTRH
jgi:hypothetical protein